MHFSPVILMTFDAIESRPTFGVGSASLAGPMAFQANLPIGDEFFGDITGMNHGRIGGQLLGKIEGMAGFAILHAMRRVIEFRLLQPTARDRYPLHLEPLARFGHVTSQALIT